MATPRKLNCNPQKSHFCIGKTGRGSCIANSKACRVSLKPGIETTIAAGTVATKPVSLPENSVISDDPRITAKTIAEAMQFLADADPEYADRFDRFSEFLASRGTVAVFREAGAEREPQSIARLVEIAETLQTRNPMIYRTLHYFKYGEGTEEERIKPLRETLGAPDGGCTGYTFREAKHIVVQSRSKDTLEPFNAPSLKESAELDIRRAEKKDPSWSIGFGHTLGTFLHEAGHQVHFAAGSPRPKGKRVSGYAGLNKDEFFAEAFELYMISPKKYKEFDPVGFQFVEETLMKSIQKVKK